MPRGTRQASGDSKSAVRLWLDSAIGRQTPALPERELWAGDQRQPTTNLIPVGSGQRRQSYSAEGTLRESVHC